MSFRSHVVGGSTYPRTSVSVYLGISTSMYACICKLAYLLLHLYGICWHERAQITNSTPEFMDNKRKLEKSLHGLEPEAFWLSRNPATYFFFFPSTLLLEHVLRLSAPTACRPVEFFINCALDYYGDFPDSLLASQDNVRFSV